MQRCRLTESELYIKPPEPGVTAVLTICCDCFTDSTLYGGTACNTANVRWKTFGEQQEATDGHVFGWVSEIRSFVNVSSYVGLPRCLLKTDCINLLVVLVTDCVDQPKRVSIGSSQ